MKLHKRTIRLNGDRKVIQITTPAGLVVAEFYDDALYSMFIAGAHREVSIYCEDTCQYIIAALGELMGDAA